MSYRPPALLLTANAMQPIAPFRRRRSPPPRAHSRGDAVARRPRCAEILATVRGAAPVLREAAGRGPRAGRRAPVPVAAAPRGGGGRAAGAAAGRMGAAGLGAAPFAAATTFTIGRQPCWRRARGTSRGPIRRGGADSRRRPTGRWATDGYCGSSAGARCGGRRRSRKGKDSGAAFTG